MVSKLLVTFVLCICLPAAIIGSPQDVAKIISTAQERVRLTKRPILVVSDYNGVLVKKVKNEETPQKDMEFLRNEVLSPLTGAGHTVYVASSKPAPKLQELLGGVPQLGLSAEHNMMVKYPGSGRFHPTTIESRTWETKLSQIKIPDGDGWKKKGEHQFSTIIEFPPSYGGDRAQAYLKNELRKVGATDYEAVLDKSKPQVMLAHTKRGKGDVVIQELTNHEFAHGVSFGDKVADEGMHKAMRAAGFHGVVVGGSPKEAQDNGFLHLSGPEEVHEVLRGLAQIRVESQ
ncbi:hypothetical protein PtA15_11A511 [Puccinia triticina]|uniref:Trehalose-phosphatase n=1 Tax=Puccinia triticina TaxID=208348 RepID=A0ABY7CYV9_9BASI|nr:uncharacterized protein PtA15_11A511 [Puccinia triticina]WAQ89820.1 hypothetical protein PtA15_11A511 [Puccinia triticina]WAR59863.1 hypothetical protein PtB15_11B504 [Puccinia triticina]